MPSRLFSPRASRAPTPPPPPPQIHAIYVDQLAPREKLAAKPGHDGINLYALAFKFVTCLIGPVLSEVSITDSLGTIMEGVGAGLFSKHHAN